jgi:hypothetical protein
MHSLWLLILRSLYGPGTQSLSDLEGLRGEESSVREGGLLGGRPGFDVHGDDHFIFNDHNTMRLPESPSSRLEAVNENVK